MRKTNLFAVAAVVILVGVGARAANQAGTITPNDAAVRMDPYRITLTATQLPTQRFEDFSMLD
jgi:hypothetical protein